MIFVGKSKAVGVEKTPLDLGLIRRMLSYTTPYKGLRNRLICVVLLRSIQLPLLPWILAKIINGPMVGGDWAGTVWGALFFILFAATTEWAFRYRQLWALQLGEYVVHDLRNQLFAHVQSMPMEYFQKTRRGRIISRLTSDVAVMRAGIQNVLFVSIVQGLQMVGSGLLMLWTNAVLFSVVLLMTPVLWALNRHFTRRMSKAMRAVQESFSRVTSSIAESVSGIRVTQGFAREGVNMGLFRNLVEDHSRYNMGAARASAVFIPLLELNTQFFMSLLLLLGGYGALHSGFAISVGDLIMFFFLANLFFSPIQVLGNQYAQALSAMAGAERVFAVLDTPPTWRDADDCGELPKIAGRVEFDNVVFSYDQDRRVLHGISFNVEAGQCVALVGATGSGKSSIINLLAKFYLPDSGEIRVDGHDLNKVSGHSLHRQLGMVLQNNFLFRGTVKENIRLGKSGADDEEIRRAAEQLDCLDLIEALPEGFDTLVGENGAGLSLGQRQLVCFMRALLADPAILILDEATSAIDTLTEARLQSALLKLARGRTTFIVAHRLSTIRHANLVLVLDAGQIVERGTHEELVEQGGVYAGLYEKFIRLTG